MNLIFEHLPEHRETWLAWIRHAPNAGEAVAVFHNSLNAALGRQPRKARPGDFMYSAAQTLFRQLREAEYRRWQETRFLQVTPKSLVPPGGQLADSSAKQGR